MTHVLIWWFLAAALVIVELLTGTFYLLVLAFAALAGSVAALVRFTLPTQLLTATACALIALAVLRWMRKRRKNCHASLDFDVGARLHVNRWHGHTSRAMYRGTQWEVELVNTEEPADQSWYEIREVRGNCLVVVPSEQPKTSI